jgi:hypothetical protein
MMDFISSIGNTLIGAVIAIVGWVFKMVFNRLDSADQQNAKIAKDLEEHKLYVANSYANKVDTKAMRDEIVRHLERIEDKMERIGQNNEKV